MDAASRIGPRLTSLCFTRYIFIALMFFTMPYLAASFAQAQQTTTNSASAAQPTKSAADVLRSTLKAVEGIDSIEYEVRMAYSDGGKNYRSRTSVLAARSPFRYRARAQNEDPETTELAAMAGTTVRASSDGAIVEAPAFSSDGQTQIALNDASAAAARTWRLFLDRDFLSSAINSGTIMYAGVDDIDGEVCDIVAYVRRMPELSASGSVIELFFISANTGLPRAVQRVNLMRGAHLSSRAVISIVRVNPKIPDGTFTYRPVAADSSPATASGRNADGESPQNNLQGTHLADLEVKDPEYKPVKLSEFVGAPLLIAFWSPWCGPCRVELQTLAKLEPTYRGKLRVIAVAVQDSRLNIQAWIKDHPGYNFTYVTDPESPSDNSRLMVYVGSRGIPHTLLVDSNGTIVDAWVGCNSGELENRVAHFLASSNKQ